MHLPFRLLDPKIKASPKAYLFQCSLASVTLLGVLSIVDAVDRAVIVAAIGSTAFILFITPHSAMAGARNVIGGHTVALLVGTAASLLNPASDLLFAVEGAVAVGVALLLMAATDTEHGPAAGTVLAVVTGGFSWSLAALLGTSVLMMVAIHRLLGKRLLNLI